MLAAYLVVWLVGLFVIVAVVSACLARLVVRDSFQYDEPFVWLRRLPPEAKPKRR